MESNVTNTSALFVQDSIGRTALFHAAERGDIEEVRRIIFSLSGTVFGAKGSA
jgi:ankyrin repeat protein